MKFAFLVIAIFINLLNHSLIKSEEKIFSAKNKIENIARKESITEEKTEIKKIHIVKSGDTISSISKFYSINKDLIIKLNNLKDENYIFVGQNLIISESTENLTRQSDLINNYHIVQTGENLTDISNKYNLKVKELIEINNINNADYIKIGQKLTITKKNTINLEKYIDKLLRISFNSRRKMLRNTLNSILSNEEINVLSESSKVCFNLRPQDISIEQWIKLAENCIKIKK